MPGTEEMDPQPLVGHAQSKLLSCIHCELSETDGIKAAARMLPSASCRLLWEDLPETDYQDLSCHLYTEGSLLSFLYVE